MPVNSIVAVALNKQFVALIFASWGGWSWPGSLFYIVYHISIAIYQLVTYCGMEILTIHRPSVHRAKIKEFIVTFISLACIFLFLSSAYSKVGEHDKFIHGLFKVNFIGPLAPVVAMLVPGLEILIAVFLVIPRTLRLGLNAFIGLMAVFTLYIGLIMIWADNLPCHCNLFIEQLSWGQHLLFNLACILLAIIALRLSNSKL